MCVTCGGHVPKEDNFWKLMLFVPGVSQGSNSNPQTRALPIEPSHWSIIEASDLLMMVQELSLKGCQ